MAVRQYLADSAATALGYLLWWAAPYLPWRRLARKLEAAHRWVEMVGLTWLAEAICYCLEQAQDWERQR